MTAATLAYEEAFTTCAQVEAQARVDRLPGARARVAELLAQVYATLDERLVPSMLALRDQIAAENAALGVVVFNPADLVWPELVGPMGRGRQSARTSAPVATRGVARLTGVHSTRETEAPPMTTFLRPIPAATVPTLWDQTGRRRGARRRSGRCPDRHVLHGLRDRGRTRAERPRAASRAGKPVDETRSARVMRPPTPASGRYPTIEETRPRRPRACLRCGRRFSTTIAERLCPGCTRATEELTTGAISAAGIVVMGRRGRAPGGGPAPPPARPERSTP